LDDPPTSPDDLFGLLKSAGGILLGSGGAHAIDTGSWMLPAILGFFLLSFLFSGLEAAFFSLGHYRLNELCAGGNKRALKLSRLLDSPGSLVGVLVILNITVNIILTAVWTSATINIAGALALKSPAGFIVCSEFILLLLLILFAELTPKALFTKNAEVVSLAFTPFMWFLYWAVIPIGVTLEVIGFILLFPFRRKERIDPQSVTEAELIGLVEVGEHEGVIDSHEKEIINSIFEFGDRQVNEVMVPRIDMTAIEEDTDLREAMEVIVASGYSRIPVYSKTVDSIVGILMTKDVLPFIGRGEVDGVKVKDIMAKLVHFVPETKPLRELFTEFQKLKIHMAIAIDEHSGTAGLITTEDMLEELVGEIADEHDTVQPMIEHQTDGSYILEGKLGLYELEELFDIEIEDHDYETVGGLIFARLGRIPVEGQIVEDQALRFQVLEVEGRRIAKIRVWGVGDKGKWGEGQ